MKQELATTFAAMLVVGTSSLWDRMPAVWKALSIIALSFMAGGVANSWFTEQHGIPARVGVLEAQVEQLQDQQAISIRLQLRMLCRQDGNTANSCDRIYSGGQRLEEME